MPEKPRIKEKTVEHWNGITIRPGSEADIDLPISQSYSGADQCIPVHVRRGPKDGPVVFITAALHGDEINGTGAIRQLVADPDFALLKGALIMVPVLNLLAFERHSRYMPDRRDLNRCFPGSSTGSLASRLAHTLFSEIVSRSDFGIDLHTAAVRRTNYPTVRGNLTNPAVKTLAKSFGSEIIISGKGPVGSFRRSACRTGCPTIIMEGGEVWKVEPGIVGTAIRGIKNVLKNLQMLEGEADQPDYQVTITKTFWLRAERGGFLQFHARPGQVVSKGQPLATNSNLLGRESNILVAPFHAVVLGMTTLPAVTPGEPVYHLGRLPRNIRPETLRKKRHDQDGLESQVVSELASNVMLVDPSKPPAP